MIWLRGRVRDVDWSVTARSPSWLCSRGPILGQLRGEWRSGGR